MKTSVIYFLSTVLFCFNCTPMNHSIGMRQVYQYPVSKNTFIAIPVDLKKIFTIDPDVDTILYGKEGTIIFIDPRCLASADISFPKGKIKIELKELYTKEALLKERACTVSNGCMLESDGSIYIQAFCENGTPLFITCENAVNIRLPTEVKENMIYFEGRRSEDGNMNWNLTETIAPIYEEVYFDFVAEDNDGYNNLGNRKKFKHVFFLHQKFWLDKLRPVLRRPSREKRSCCNI